MTGYQATRPPAGAVCGTAKCGSVAAVRVVVPPSLFTADGLPHDEGGRPVTRDACPLHWPGVRDVFARNGHPVADVTGDVIALALEFPRWNVFTSDTGRLYAARPAGGQGVTVDAYLVGQLRDQMAEQERGAAGG